MAGLAFALGFLYSANLNQDWLLKLLRKRKITQRTARSSIWNDAFQDIPSSFVLVQISRDRTLIGFVRYYSDDPEEDSIFLETKLAGIKSVPFLKSRLQSKGPTSVPDQQTS